MGNLGGNLPALDVHPPAAPPNPLEEFARVAQIRAQQQNQAAQAQEMQIRQQQINDQQATTAAMKDWDASSGDYDGLAKSVLAHGGSANAATAIQQHGIQVKTALSTLDKDALASYQTKQKAIADQLEGLTDPNVVPDEQLAGKTSDVLNNLVQNRILDPAHYAQLQQGVSSISDPTALRTKIDQFAKATMGASAVAAQAKTEAETKHLEAQTQEQQASTEEKQWQKFPEAGVLYNTKTGEIRTPLGQTVPPQMIESKYVGLAAKKAQGQPLSPEDAAFMKGVEKYKELVPQFNLNMQTSGAGMIPGGGGANGGTPAGGGQPAKPNISQVPLPIRGRVQQIVDYRAQLPPAGRNNPTNNAISYWVNNLDPQHDDTTFPARNKLMTAFTSGSESHQINAVNTAMGHVGVLNDAIDALQNHDTRALNALGNRLGIEFGTKTGDNAAMFKSIVHKVGPELTAAYVQGGGGEGERGTTASDFDENLAPSILHGNTAITAKLLRSKISSLENQYKNTMGRDDFQQRFITPEAQQTLDKLSPKGGGGGSTSGKSVSLAAAKQLPRNAGKSDEDIKADIEAHGHTVAP